MVVNYVKTNPHKSQAKLESMNNIMAVCLTIFGIMWAFSPDRLNGPILLQFVLAIPLLYVSGLAYTKVAYRKEVKFWDNFGWFTSTVATAFVLNIVGILIFLLGRVQIALLYFAVTWLLLVLYTTINIYNHPRTIGIKLFKLFFFIILQLIFGIGVFYLF